MVGADLLVKAVIGLLHGQGQGPIIRRKAARHAPSVVALDVGTSERQDEEGVSERSKKNQSVSCNQSNKKHAGNRQQRQHSITTVLPASGKRQKSTFSRVELA